jgi:hypothetical protein
MKLSGIIIAFAMTLTPLSAIGGPITYNFSSGTLAATAVFSRSGSDLVVTLSNTSAADATVPTDILTGIFFEVTGDPLLTRTSALVALGSSVLVGGTGADVTPLDRVVGGEWAYLNALNQVPSTNEGISSSGLGIFGPGNVFPGANLQGPASPAGIQYGITSAGDNLTTGNGGLSGENLIKNSVVFTLSGYSGEPSANITSAAFQYGTALDEPRFPGTFLHAPEPGSWVLLGLGGLGLAICRWRQRRR